MVLVLCGVCTLAGVVGAADVFLEATRPDFQKISLGVVSIENSGGPDWLGGRLEEVLKKDVKRSLVFELMQISSNCATIWRLWQNPRIRIKSGWTRCSDAWCLRAGPSRRARYGGWVFRGSPRWASRRRGAKC